MPPAELLGMPIQLPVRASPWQAMPKVRPFASDSTFSTTTLQDVQSWITLPPTRRFVLPPQFTPVAAWVTVLPDTSHVTDPPASMP